MKDNQYLIVAAALVIIYFLYQHLTNEINTNQLNNGKKQGVGDFPIPQTTSITQRLTNGLKALPSMVFSDVDDSPKKIIRNKGGNTGPIYARNDDVKEDIISANPIGSTEFTFVESKTDVAWSDDNVSQHPSYHKAKFNDSLTNVGAFFKNNEFHDKTSPQSENHLPDRCFLHEGGIICEFNDKLQNIPPKLIMDEKYNQVLDSIGGLQQRGKEVNDEKERPNNGGEFFKDVFASSSRNEDYLNLDNLPNKDINYSF